MDKDRAFPTLTEAAVPFFIVVRGAIVQVS